MFFTKKKKLSTQERIEQFPKTLCGIDKDIHILWNEYQVPYIYAETDHDGAFALGMVHAHLRLGQIEVAKRLAFGRMSEMFGVFMRNVDEALRILAPAGNVKNVLAAMPKETRDWVEAYTKGINHYKENLTPNNTPHEFKLLGIDNSEPWTAEDSIAIGRLFGTDVHWMTWLEQLPQSTQEDFARIWAYMHEVGHGGTVSFIPTKDNGKIDKVKKDLSKLKTILQDTQKSGSNSIVIGKNKSETGSSLIANDPHLGFMIPNAWVMAALKCPSYEVVGMMPPGVPIFGFGRTPHFAWGGTNMRALSSDMVDVTDRPQEEFETHEELIKTRFWFSKKIKVRKTPHGPVLSDAKFFPKLKGKDIAVRWIGHENSDETTALLKASKAKTWKEFYDAMPSFAIPPQNFLFAGKKGDIGYVLATQIAKRVKGHEEHLVTPFDIYKQSWEEILNSSTLPHAYEPEDGFLASANNRPIETEYPIGYFFPQDERIRRIKQRITQVEKWSVQALMRLQRDSVSLTSLELKDLIFEKTKKFEDKWSADLIEAADFLRQWDGSYSKDSKGAYLFTAFLVEFAPLLYSKLKRLQDFEQFKNDAYFRDLLKRDVVKVAPEDIAKKTAKALKKITQYYHDDKKWGDVHRLELFHYLARLPILKYFYERFDFAHGGTRETIMKAAHPLTIEKHRAYYGAQSRHISDLSDLDENYFVLAGGQDGCINSENFMDQAELFTRGDYVKMPLTDEAVKVLFKYETILSPK